MLKPRRVVPALVAALALVSCAGPRVMTVADTGDGDRLAHRVRITGYATRDGSRHAWAGFAEPAGPDSLRLVATRVPRSRFVTGTPERVVTIARRDAWRLDEDAPGMAFLAVIGIAALVIPIAWFAFMQSQMRD